MKTNVLRQGGANKPARHVMAVICVLLLITGKAPAFARLAQQPAEESVKIPPDHLDALVAPIALYPDPLLSQTLAASTYPLELMQLKQWLERNKSLKDKALVDAVSKQPWDPSVQAMAALPEVVERLTNDIQWTTDLGNAFLAQQSDVMNAVQRMRKKAQDNGALMSNAEQKVENQVIENKSVIVVEQAQPEVVYVPEYNPVAVYGAAVYPYPAIYYPAYTPGVVAAGAISFGVGVAMGAAWGGGWGWGAGWGNNDVNINRNNNFNRNTSISGNRAASNKWQHNAQHRGGAPYADRATANRFGSNARGDSLASRQKGAQQQVARQKSSPGSRSSRGAESFGGRSGTGGADRAGSRSVGSSSGRDRGGFAGGSSGFSGKAARSSSSRGSSSFGGAGRSGGGFGGGGGGRSRGGGRR